MLKKEYNNTKKEIRESLNEHSGDAYGLALSLIEELFRDKQYDLICDLYGSKFLEFKEPIYCFELAYALSDQRKYDDAEIIYKILLGNDPDNTSILNNLHIILKRNGQIDGAWNLIRKANDLNPNDDIISKNFESLAETILARDEKNALFKSAVKKIEKENSFVLDKLSNFLSNSRRDTEYKNCIIPIPKWKFKVLMGTDDQKAQSLLQQWLDKGYLYKTGDRGQYNELVYEINPHISSAIQVTEPQNVNENWINTLSNLNAETLAEHGYYDAKRRISKIKKSFRDNINRDLDELYINFLLKNSKSVIILSGSLVELLLIYFLEKRKITTVAYNFNNKSVSRKLYDCTLFDLLNFCDQQALLKNVIVHLGNVSRLHRNYIHPGKELKDNEPLDFIKATLCFSTTIEILKAVTK